MKAETKMRRDLAVRLLALCALMMIAAAAGSATRPIFNPHANARRDIAAAIRRASKTGRNIVLIFGANW